MARKKMTKPIPCRLKFCFKITLSFTVTKIHASLGFTQKFDMAAKNGGKRFLAESGR